MPGVLAHATLLFVRPTVRAEPDRGRVRGSAFREFVFWYGQVHGQARLDAIALASGLPLTTSRLTLGAPALGILPSRWYPVAVVHALLDRMIEGVSIDDRRTMATEGARHVMGATLRGVYRVLFEWIATPARYARFAGRLWASYYDSGEVKVVLDEDGRAAVCTVTRWAAHHPFMCELNLAAATEIYAAMGCRGVHTVRSRCVDDGDDDCCFTTRWTGR